MSWAAFHQSSFRKQENEVDEPPATRSPPPEKAGYEASLPFPESVPPTSFVECHSGKEQEERKAVARVSEQVLPRRDSFARSFEIGYKL